MVHPIFKTRPSKWTWTGARFTKQKPRQKQLAAPNLALLLIRARYYDPNLGEFISRDPLGFVDGMSLYRGYFVPGGMDPFGEKVAHYIERDGVLYYAPYFNTQLSWKLDKAEEDKIDSLTRSIQMAELFAQTCEDENVRKELLAYKNWAEWYVLDIIEWNPNSRWLGRPAQGATITFPFNQYETGKAPLSNIFLDGLALGCGVGLSEGAMGGMPKSTWDVLKNNPRFIYGRSADQIQKILGPNWIQDVYGSSGKGWKFTHRTKNDRMIFFNTEGRHVGSYWGISGTGKGRIKLVGPNYRADPDDKADIICCTCKKIAEFLKGK